MENFLIEIVKTHGLWAAMFALLFWWYLREVKSRESVTKEWLSAIVVIQTKIDAIEKVIEEDDVQTRACANDHGSLKESLSTLTTTVDELKGNEFDKRALHEKMINEQAVLKSDIAEIKSAVNNLALISMGISDIKNTIATLNTSMMTSIRGVSHDKTNTN